jgi:hypothetical protein
MSMFSRSINLNKINNIPIIPDPFSFANYNGLILGTSGGGKSVTAKLFILRNILRGVKTIMIDPQGEYVDLTKTYNGQLVEIHRESNSIIKVYLVVWANKQKTSTLRYGWAGATIFEETTGKEIKLPMIIGPKEALKIKVKFILSPKGTTDERLLSEMEPLFPGSNMHLPKHNYVLCFEDVEENMFDQAGNMINIEEINLNWTLPNTMTELQKGNILPFIKHFLLILKSRIIFFFRKILFALVL